MGVSKNSGTPKWMVIMENPIKIDDLGVSLFLETSILYIIYVYISPVKPSCSKAIYRAHLLSPSNYTGFCMLSFKNNTFPQES